MAMTPQAVELTEAHRLLNHGPVLLISSGYQGKRNVMAVAWSMPLDFEPARVAVIVGSKAYTRSLMEASGRFAINVPTRAQAAKVLAAGSKSGRDGDKFADLGLESFTCTHPDLPLVAGCAAWMECSIEPEGDMQTRYDLFVGRVLAAWADPAIYSEGAWHFASDDQRTLHYTSGGFFSATGDAFEVKA
jgi:flavin reductase (DIM6/NTAB) family NADH-FMN oxidoreductase RutF